MDEIKLDVQIRDKIGTQGCNKIRKNDFIPSIVYGGKHKSSPVKIDRGVFERLERQHKGESIVLRLNVLEGEKKVKDYHTIVKEVQYDPVTDKILHIDFHRISLTEEIEVKVPIATKGEAIGVKKESGSLDQHIWELSVVCLPTKIPQNIEVDVSNLNINESIYVKNLLIPEGVKTKHDPEDIVVTVAPPMKAEVPTEEAEAAAPEEPEVIKEKKEEAASEQPEEAKPKEEKSQGK